MNTLEGRLRSAYRAAATTVADEEIRPLADLAQSGPARPGTPPASRRRLAPLVAAGAVAVIMVAVAVAVPHSPSGNGKAPAARRSVAAGHSAGHPAGSLAAAFPAGRVPGGPMPRYIAEIQYLIPQHSLTAVVRIVSSASGKTVGSLAAPPHVYFQAIGYLGGNRSFVVAGIKVTGTGRSASGPCASFFYRFRLSASGEPEELTPLPVARVYGGVEQGNLAGSADGNVVAYDPSFCIAVSPAAHSRSGGLIGAIDLRDRSVRNWTYPSGEYPDDLSLSATGALTGLMSGEQQGSIWTLPTSSPSGKLARYSRTAIPGPGLRGQEGVLSPTGQVAYVIRESLKAGQRIYDTVSAFDTSTGRLIRTLGSFPVRTHGASASMAGLKADASGRYLLFALGRNIDAFDLITGRLTVLPRPQNQLNDAAW